MSLSTPTTQEINDNLIAQLEASLSQTIPLLPKSFMRVLSKALAGVFVILYKYGGFTFLQMFVSSASSVETLVNGRLITPLTEWGRLIGVGDIVPATNAELTIDITVTNQTGFLPSGTQLVAADNGVTYITIGDIALSASLVVGLVRAASDQAGGGGAGAIGNLPNASIMSFVNPLANVVRDTVVASTTVTGADGESVDAYRQRIIDRFQKRPQGGALADYEAWGEEPAGIVNVYPYTGAEPGQVDVYVEATTDVDPDGIPTTPQLEEVLDSINLDVDGRATRRPANALANTFAITRTAFTVEVNSLTADDLPTVKGNIDTALAEYFLAREPFIEGLSIPPRRDTITNGAVAGVVDDIVSAAGGTFQSVVVKETGTPFTLRSLGIGEKAKVTTVTYL